jgi:ABC-type dipeptide/oligopeptide/nickel transport system ATPase component
MIRLDNIVATYTTQRGQVNAVDGVTLEIPDSIVMGIAGESGCGKSTLMKVIYGDIGFRSASRRERSTTASSTNAASRSRPRTSVASGFGTSPTFRKAR